MWLWLAEQGLKPVAYERYLGITDRSHFRRGCARAGITVPRRAPRCNGDSVTIGETVAGEQQVLFFFTTSCPHSRKTLPAWNRIASEVGRQGADKVFGIQLDSHELAPR